MIFRTIGVFFLALGIVAAIIALVFALDHIGTTIIIAAVYVLPLNLLGAFFFVLSKKLARWVCHDFEKFND